jgi:hypothetical protein
MRLELRAFLISPPARPPALPLILKSKTFAEQNDPATE